MSRTCPSCGSDTSAVKVKTRLFSQFWVQIIRCPYCRLRETFLTMRQAVEVLPVEPPARDDASIYARVRARRRVEPW